MTKTLVTSLLCTTVAGLVIFVWAGPHEIKHYTANELSELACDELGERHEEVIFAYHDAELAHKKRTGAFHDDLGLPSEDVIPYAVLMKWFMHENNINAAAIMTRPSPTPILRSSFYYEISSTCATNPSWQAVEAMQQAAIKLGLADGKVIP